MIIVEDQTIPSCNDQFPIQGSPSWMDLVVLFLKEGLLPEEKVESEKIQRKALRYWLFKEHKLYKYSHAGPYLLCIHLDAVEPLLEELHKGVCGNHTGGRSLSHRALT